MCLRGMGVCLCSRGKAAIKYTAANENVERRLLNQQLTGATKPIRLQNTDGVHVCTVSGICFAEHRLVAGGLPPIHVLLARKEWSGCLQPLIYDDTSVV